MSVRMGLRPLLVCSALFMSTQLAPAQVKVGVINLQRAVFESAEIKKADAQMQATFKPRQDKIDALNKDLAALSQQLQSSNGKLSPSGRGRPAGARTAQAARFAAPHRRSAGRCERVPQRHSLQEFGEDAGGGEETRRGEGSRPGGRLRRRRCTSRSDGYHQ